MEASSVLFYLLLILIPLLPSAASNSCPVSHCGQFFTNVRFPFRLIDTQPQRCGFPGFDLRCISPRLVLINLPSSGEFGVRAIDYRSQRMQIYDPSNCFPARLLNFDLSGSPFAASYFQNYTLLSCPNDASLARYTRVSCLSNSSFLTIATASMSFVALMTSNQTGCQITGNLRMPVAEPPDQNELSSNVEEDITLTWSKPDCEICEAEYVSCGYANSTTQSTKCFFNGGIPKGSQVFRIIAFAMAIPAMAASLAIACFMCTKDRRNELISNRRRTVFNAPTMVFPDAVVTPPNVIGLDQATIESYTKVVLGESKRLPGHDDGVCPICLSEYHVKETVRCIPECRHCFHSECIDEWLKMNGSCPICRNSPSPVHVAES
ncbi:putative RING-H2 finger protein ATL21A [Cynara cardunculus var. scolymus]|uniref:putative RING-H2 finger protein ATL21A n=1 Tax=Cynara cardunculus var. scolymus TaxID=59895 RepID=UPI000D623D78|nr:putative RING-H2 finger protein ATL21A [Cynara cardunculus var. scolymus]